jgi:proline dehydrogenase
LKDMRLRLVKGAYKENDQLSLQKKVEIDANYFKLIKKRLLHPGFTSIATHDRNIINEVKQFVIVNDIPIDKFEFQMLYGFRTDMQLELVKEGFPFCTYVPFGHDWYGYFMRRLAERPQNLNLVLKSLVANYFA